MNKLFNILSCYSIFESCTCILKTHFMIVKKQATNEPKLLSRTRQYICKELILENSPILKLPMLITIQTCPYSHN